MTTEDGSDQVVVQLTGVQKRYEGTAALDGVSLQIRRGEAVAVMELEGTVDEMMFTIHAHPTLNESLLDGYGAVEGLQINA